MKSKQKLFGSLFACVLICLLPISCENNGIVEKEAQTEADTIIEELDKIGATYGVIIEFNPEYANKIFISEIESTLKSMGMQPKELGEYTFQGKHIILNPELPRIGTQPKEFRKTVHGNPIRLNPEFPRIGTQPEEFGNFFHGDTIKINSEH
jgi:hypothetical protein